MGFIKEAFYIGAALFNIVRGKACTPEDICDISVAIELGEIDVTEMTDREKEFFLQQNISDRAKKIILEGGIKNDK